VNINGSLIHGTRPRPLTEQKVACENSGSNSSTHALLDGFTPTKDQDWVDAGKLMKEAGVPVEGHTLMQENLATFLAHRLSGTPSARWTTRINRDLKTPYTDEQVFQRIDKLQSALQERIAESGAMPSKLYITGSFAKGRLSVNDELNTLNVVSKDQYPQVLDKAMIRDAQGDVHFFPLREDQASYNQGMLMVDGVSIGVDPKVAMQPGYLQKTYTEILQNKSQNRRELQPRLDKWLGKAHRSRYDSQSLHSRMMQTAVATLGLASRVPLMGPLVKSSFAFLVGQKHQ
jgi:hypothetical protein